jgi:hypothetical protein
MDVLKFQHSVVEKKKRKEERQKRRGIMKGEDHRKEKEKTEPYTELDKEEERIFKQEGIMGMIKESKERKERQKKENEKKIS